MKERAEALYYERLVVQRFSAFFPPRQSRAVAQNYDVAAAF
jgi:hypothetical protein